MRSQRHNLTIPMTMEIRAALNRHERAFRKALRIPDLPLLTKLFTTKDGRGGTHLVCHLHVVFPNGVSSNSEGRGPEPIVAIHAAFERMAAHATFCLKWTQLRPSNLNALKCASSQ